MFKRNIWHIVLASLLLTLNMFYTFCNVSIVNFGQVIICWDRAFKNYNNYEESFYIKIDYKLGNKIIKILSMKRKQF